ncbi:hypothetical protein DFH11DRAFT_1655852 [Phellopilus nigrolimitatus]|nr:hypothetical protein DFH11DRAFT_1655852 [Phellopilus nigrolimitatus]
MNNSAHGNTTDRVQLHRPLAYLSVVLLTQCLICVSSTAIADRPLGQFERGQPVDCSDPYQDDHLSGTPDYVRWHTTAAQKLDESFSATRSPRQQTGLGTTPLLDPYSQLQQMSAQTAATADFPTSTVYQNSSPTETPSAPPYQPPVAQQQASSKGTSPLGSPFAGQRSIPIIPIITRWILCHLVLKWRKNLITVRRSSTSARAC